ncbi:translation protein, partial [Coccomyxa subellipsoidea C-169]
RRCGVLAVKAGMTQEWDQWGARVPLTVLWVDDCQASFAFNALLQVVQIKTPAREGYLALQVGCGSKRPKQVNRGQLGHFEWAGVPIKRRLTEFRVTEDALLPVGTMLTAAHFTPGQYVDVQGTTLGKGFQGVMKRWGFAGQPASHGNSLAHRAAGGIGACQDPGKVWPGKKMAGRMGGVTRTLSCAYVFKVDAARNLIYVRGQVPGHKGNFVRISDAALKTFGQQPQRPVPTFLDPLPLEPLLAPKSEKSPFDYKE